MTLLVLLLLLLPGVPLAAPWQTLRRDPVIALGRVVLLALAFWIVGFWFLRWLPIGLTGLVAVVSALTLLLAAWHRRELRSWAAELGGSVRENPGPLLLILGVLALRAIPLLLVPVAPGADMSMHSMMARLILDADGVPTSHAPLLPIADFGGYGAGMPSFAAVLAHLAAIDAARAAFWAATVSQMVVVLALYAAARTLLGPARRLLGPPALHTAEPVSSWPATLAAVAIACGSRDPQAHFLWGGNPTVLSFALAVAALPLLALLRSARPALVLAPALLLAAAAETHAVIPYGLGLVVLVTMAALAARERRNFTFSFIFSELKPWALGAATATLLAILLMLPWATGVHVDLTPGERQWIQEWQRLPSHVPNVPGWLVPPALVWHVGVRLGVPFVLLLAAGLWLGRRHRVHPGVLEGALVLATLALIANTYVWWLPGSVALYPDRLGNLFTLPATLLLARVLDAEAIRPTLGLVPRRVLLALGGVAVLFGVGYWHVRGVRNVSVTDDDLAAFAWISQSVPRPELIENNYGDAGIWLPAMTGHPVRNAHVNIVYMDDVKPWRSASLPTWLYIGSKRVYEDASPYDPAATLTNTTCFARRFHQGDAAVYERIGPATCLAPPP
ncbi:MAG: hypothetical protein IV100_29765 [Myxococcales bacterium]|nr:hypothetical protein [Myxococcales bacterium]